MAYTVFELFVRITLSSHFKNKINRQRPQVITLNSKFVTGAKLRKYIATISQVLMLMETEIDCLARRLGREGNP